MSIRTCTNTFQLPFGRAGPDPWALPAARSPDARAPFGRFPQLAYSARSFGLPLRGTAPGCLRNAHWGKCLRHIPQPLG